MVRKTVKWFWRIYLLLVFLFILLLVLINFNVFGPLPSLSELENPTLLQASEVYAADGTPMGKYFKEDRTNVELKDMSKYLLYALVATEDKRFFEHSGIDAEGLGRSAVGLLTFSPKGGASTISQQLSLALLKHDRSGNPFVRGTQKLKEWITSLKLERNFTKEEILALYLNTMEFPDNCLGIRNACLTFFQKEPDRLNASEAALIIGSLNNPTEFNPRKNPKSAINRRNLVLDRMATSGDIAQKFGLKPLNDVEANNLKTQPIVLNYKKKTEQIGVAPYFKDVIKDEILKWCKENKKSNGKNYDLYKDGLKIYTSIDTRMQAYAEQAVVEHMKNNQRNLNSQGFIRTGKVWEKHAVTLEKEMKKSERWKEGKEAGLSEEDIKKQFYVKTRMKIFAWNAKNSMDTVMTPMDSIKYHRQVMQAGFIAMDPLSGQIKAWVGGVDYKTFKFDHCNTSSKRQVGSTIKPLLYVLAMKNLGYTPETIIQSNPQYFDGYGWYPSNNKASGSIALAQALAYSKNPAAAYLLKQTGIKNFMDWLRELKVTSDLKAYPSLCLGAFEISMYEMMQAYTMFPGKGFNTKPVTITRIEDKNGNVIKDFDTERKIVLSELDAFNMVKCMTGVTTFGTGKRMSAYYGGQVAGKTGTTNDNSDCWFMGYTPQLLAGAWVGCEERFIRIADGAAMGSTIAMPIMGKFLGKVYGDKDLSKIYKKDLKFEQPKELAAGADYDISRFVDPTQETPDVTMDDELKSEDYTQGMEFEDNPNDVILDTPKKQAPQKTPTPAPKNPGDKPKAKEQKPEDDYKKR
jgi:penicillin-binding protein 1A